MSTEQGYAEDESRALLFAEILRAYQALHQAQAIGDHLSAERAEKNMNWLLDQLPVPRVPADEEGPSAQP